METNLSKHYAQLITRHIQDVLVNDLGIRNPTAEELAEFCFGPSALWGANLKLNEAKRCWYAGLYKMQHINDQDCDDLALAYMDFKAFVEWALRNYENSPARVFDRIRSTGVV